MCHTKVYTQPTYISRHDTPELMWSPVDLMKPTILHTSLWVTSWNMCSSYNMYMRSCCPADAMWLLLRSRHCYPPLWLGNTLHIMHKQTELNGTHVVASVAYLKWTRCTWQLNMKMTNRSTLPATCHQYLSVWSDSRPFSLVPRDIG